tara:strand:+ start:949 stop:1740 length:792 start_codon:yes stop_codon:yes gene_type:complete
MKILVIGKRSIIANSFYSKYKKKIKITLISFNNAKKLSINKINKFDWILNCAFKKNIHNLKNNPDLIILKKIKNESLKYIMMSTSKVYASKKFKIFIEKEKCIPNSQYGKIRLNTEKKLINSLKNRLLILRLSNVLNYNPQNKKKYFNTIDQMIYNLKIYKKIFLPKDKVIKDFITLDFLIKNIYILIRKNKTGIFNVSSTIKITLENIAKIITKKFKRGEIIKRNYKTNSFLLLNKKLLNITKIKIDKKEIINTINNFKIRI